MKRITTKQFVWSSLSLTLGCILWLLPGDIWSDFAPGWIVISMLIVMSREGRSRPLPKLYIVALVGALAFCVGVVLAMHRFVPDDWRQPLLRVARYPALVVPLWAAMIFLLFRRWRHGKTDVADPGAAPLPPKPGPLS